jgi:hypothetical protein
MMLARGHAIETTVYQVRFGSPQWLALARRQREIVTARGR